MQTIDLSTGTHIDRAAALLVTRAPARATFNGIALRARYATTKPGDVAARYQRLCAERSYVYQCSPEGREEAERGRRDIEAKQATVDRLSAALPDFANPSAVLAWLVPFAEAADRTGVTFARVGLILDFVAGGWPPGANCGEEFDGEDARNFAGWIVGQWLDGIDKRGAAHAGLIGRFAADWRAKFEPVAA